MNKTVTFSGVSIHYGEKSIKENNGQREFAKWKSAIEELKVNGFIKRIGIKDEIYKITNNGYKYLESQLK